MSPFGTALSSVDYLTGSAALEALLGQNEGNDQTIKTKRLREDENQDHSNEKSLLLTDGADTGVTNNANRHTGGETTEAAAHTSSQVSIAREARIFRETVRVRGGNCSGHVLRISLRLFQDAHDLLDPWMMTATMRP